MDLNLSYNESKEVTFFVNKFMEKEWKQEDFAAIINELPKD